MPKFSNPTAYAGKKGNTKKTGQARFATTAESAAATADDLIISPATLDSALDTLLPIITSITLAGALDTNIPSTLAAKTYIDNIAVAGAPAWSESVSGIGQLATDAESVTGTATDVAIVPSSLTARLAAPGAIGGTTPAAGSFSTLAATGAIDFDAGGSFESGGATINIGADASGDAMNFGTGAASRAIIIGNTNTGTAVTINTGTGHFTVNTTSTGDIILNSDDTMLLDSDGVLELNSSAGVINIGNDDIDQAINIGSDGVRAVLVGSQNGAASLTLDSGTGAIDIGTTIAKSVTIGNNTGSTAVVIDVGTGNFDLNGVGASTYDIGASTTSGTITIGGTAQTGALGLGVSSGIMITNLSTGNGAKTLNVATGISGNTLNIGTGANSSAQVINVASGASAANSTVNILSGNGSAGTQTLNVLSGTRAGALNLGSGAAAHVIAIGSASAGAITLDTASSVSIDAAAASNFTTSAGDITIQASAASVNIIGNENDAGCVVIEADGGISERIYIHSDQGTGVDSIFLESDVGGITMTADAFDFNAINGGVTIDSTLGISLDSGVSANFSTSGAGNDLNLISAAGRVVVNGEEAAANAITLVSAAGGIDVDGALQVNIASSQAATGALTLAVSNAAANITHTGACAYTPDSVTSDNAGVAASINTVVTLITTDGDSNEDNVTLADGLIAGQIKHFAVIAAGNAADSIKITPANMAGGSKITFAADPTGLGCSMVFDGTNWCIFANNGGTIA